MNYKQRREIEALCETAKGIAWDTCHKIYILLDDDEVEKMRGYGYDPLITANEATPDEMLYTVVDWFEQSCGLRFITAVDTKDGEPVFVSVIDQLEGAY